MTQFKVGDRVRHRDFPAFGVGVVFHIETEKSDFVFIEFEDKSSGLHFEHSADVIAHYGKSEKKVWTTNERYVSSYEFLPPLPSFAKGDKVVTSADRSMVSAGWGYVDPDFFGKELVVDHIKHKQGEEIAYVAALGYFQFIPTRFLKAAPVPAPKPTKVFSPNSQCGKLLTLLASGRSITPLEAFGTLGIYRLAARIHELKQAGHKVLTNVRYDDQGKPYARYSLKSRRFV